MLYSPPGPSNEGHSQVAPSGLRQPPSRRVCHLPLMLFTYLFNKTQLRRFFYFSKTLSWLGREGGDSPRSVAFGSGPWSITGNNLRDRSAGALMHQAKRVRSAISGAQWPRPEERRSTNALPKIEYRAQLCRQQNISTHRYPLTLIFNLVLISSIFEVIELRKSL